MNIFCRPESLALVPLPWPRCPPAEHWGASGVRLVPCGVSDVQAESHCQRTGLLPLWPRMREGLDPRVLPWCGDALSVLKDKDGAVPPWGLFMRKGSKINVHALSLSLSAPEEGETERRGEGRGVEGLNVGLNFITRGSQKAPGNVLPCLACVCAHWYHGKAHV